MVKSLAKTVDEYLLSLSPERREVIAAVRKIILKNLPKGYEERMNWGMISYEIPLKRYSPTYNGQPLSYAALASQKNNISLYLMSLYREDGSKQWFEERYKAAGKKLNMGKSCIRFKQLSDLPLELIGELIARTSVDSFIEGYEKIKKPEK